MSSSRRTEPLPPGWEAIRRRVLRSYDYLCAQCDDPANQVDHIVPTSQGGGHEMSNLQALCTPCHNRKTSREAHAARRRRSRDSEPHPGRVVP